MKLTKPLKKISGIAIEILSVIPCFCISIISRYAKRDIDVGLGPEPIINNVYIKKALMQAGFTAETFVSETFFITDEFDLDISKWRDNFFLKHCIPYFFFLRALFQYRVLFIYFNGGPFYRSKLLCLLEPIFFKLANVKTIVMPYGSDAQILSRSKNLYFKHALNVDYPNFWKKDRRNRQRIDRWTRHADWVITAGDCVDYMYRWDSLAFNVLPIDTQHWAPTERKGHQVGTNLRILHAPNHPMIKGTDTLITAVELLKKEGLDLELILLRGVPNAEIRRAMEDIDLVADQFVIGCYGLFAIEAMAMEKPVLCYLRKDLVELYIKAGVVGKDEIPLINTDLLEIASKIRWAYHNREELREIGKKGREFIQKYHSIESIGRFFAGILNELGIMGK